MHIYKSASWVKETKSEDSRPETILPTCAIIMKIDCKSSANSKCSLVRLSKWSRLYSKAHTLAKKSIAWYLRWAWNASTFHDAGRLTFIIHRIAQRSRENPVASLKQFSQYSWNAVVGNALFSNYGHCLVCVDLRSTKRGRQYTRALSIPMGVRQPYQLRRAGKTQPLLKDSGITKTGHRHELHSREREHQLECPFAERGPQQRKTKMLSTWRKLAFQQMPSLLQVGVSTAFRFTTEYLAVPPIICYCLASILMTLVNKVWSFETPTFIKLIRLHSLLFPEQISQWHSCYYAFNQPSALVVRPFWRALA